MQTTNRKISDYIESLEKEDRSTMQTLVDIAHKSLPKVKPELWEGKFWSGFDNSIIGFGKIVMKGKTREVEWFLVGITKQKNYFSIYVIANDGKNSLGKIYADKLGKVKIGSSSISFQKIEDIKLNVLEEMFKEAYVLMKDKIVDL